MFLIFKQYINRKTIFEHDFERPIASIFKLLKHCCKETINTQKSFIKPFDIFEIMKLDRQDIKVIKRSKTLVK